jgi:hypothetical protein
MFLTSSFIDQAITLTTVFLAQPASLPPLSPAQPAVNCCVTMEDGLFFSYLLSRQSEDGVVERTGKTGPPRNVRVNTIN